MYACKNLGLVCFLFVFFSCSNSENEKIAAVDPPAEEGVQYAGGSARNIQQVLKAYYRVKDALVASDSLQVKEAASLLVSALDTLQLLEDSSLHLSAGSYPGNIKEASIDLSKQSLLEEQRAIFETISENLYALIQAVRPAGIETYKQYCPMAFNDKGAFWLSDTAHIQNPYFGKKMLICGEVQEELRY